MGKYSRDKGARAERQWRDICRAEGYDAERGCQLYQKGSEIADVVGLPGIHVEVKNCERLNLRDAMTQSISDAEAEGVGNIPIVAHKKNRCPWLVTLRSEDFFRLYREWEAGRADIR
jgi:Holliday junction resolvase